MEPFHYVLLKKDSSESIFFTRELTKVQAKSYDVKFPALKGRMFVPIGDAGMSNADEVGLYETYTSFGVAQWVSDYGSDFPRADVKGSETAYKVYSIGDSYGYNIQEARKAAQTGKPLEARRATAAREAIERKLDDVLWFGDTTKALFGLTNQPNCLDYAVPNGAGASPLWSLKTPDEVYKDLMGIVSTITQTTKGVEIPNTLALPLTRYEYIRDTRMNTFSDATILQVFLKNVSIPGFRVDWSTKLETAASGGGVLMICYRNSPDAILGVITQEFEQFPPQNVNMEVKIACHARTGGVISYYPLSICTADLF